MPWLPTRLRHTETGPVVDWCEVPDGAMTGPFFDPSARCRTAGNRSSALDALAADDSAPLPSGLIFHVSRCGSTLFARQLAAVPGSRVLSEPPIVESLLRWPGLDAVQRRARLHGLLAAFAAGSPPPRASVIKFAARALLDHASIRAAGMGVPCVVLYRDPAEVLVALVGTSTALPPGLREAMLLDDPGDPDRTDSLEPVEFWARVLARQYASAADLAACEGVLLLRYDALPDAAWQCVAPHFGLALDAADRTAMQAAAARNAKSGQAFIDDRAAKRARVSAEIAAAVERWIAPHHARLEALQRVSTPV